MSLKQPSINIANDKIVVTRNDEGGLVASMGALTLPVSALNIGADGNIGMMTLSVDLKNVVFANEEDGTRH